MSETSRRGFFRTLAAGVAAAVASRAASALPLPAVPLARGARMHAALKELLGEDIYVSWFYAMRVGDCDGHTLTAFVPVKFLKRWIETHYAAETLAAARTEFFGVQRVELFVRGAQPTTVSGSFKWWNKKRGFGHFVGDDGAGGWIRLRKSHAAVLTPSADRLRMLITPAEPVTLVGTYAIDPDRTRWEIAAVVLASGERVPVDTYIVFDGGWHWQHSTGRSPSA